MLRKRLKAGSVCFPLMERRGESLFVFVLTEGSLSSLHTAIYCTLQCTALHCNALHCNTVIELWWTHCTVMHFIALWCTSKWWNKLCCTEPSSTVLWYTAAFNIYLTALYLLMCDLLHCDIMHSHVLYFDSMHFSENWLHCTESTICDLLDCDTVTFTFT